MLPEDVFKAIHQLAKDHNHFRSEVFVKASKEYLERIKSKAILDALNAAYADEETEEEKTVTMFSIRENSGLSVVPPPRPSPRTGGRKGTFFQSNLSASLYYGFYQVFVYFAVSGNWLNYSGYRILIPIVFATMANNDAPDLCQMPEQVGSFHATCSSPTFRTQGVSPLERSR